MTARVSRRSMFVGSVSLALHGAVLLLAFPIARVRVVQHRPVVEWTEIQVVDPSPPPPPLPLPRLAPGPPRSSTSSGSRPTAKAGTAGRHGHDTRPRSQTRAPVVAGPYADLVMSQEARTGPDPGSPAHATGPGMGTGRLGTGIGASVGFGPSGNGLGATLDVPPPPPSLARPPHPKHSYDSVVLLGSSEFAGAIVRVELSIDPQGVVRQVRLLHGVDNEIDQRAINIARGFQFDPALSSTGEPTSGRYLWDFVLEDEEKTRRSFHSD